MEESRLYRDLSTRTEEAPREMCMNSLKVPNIAEKAVMFLFAEQNLLTEEVVRSLVDELSLDREYISRTLADNRRPVNLSQYGLRF
jgi:thymidine kinase